MYPAGVPRVTARAVALSTGVRVRVLQAGSSGVRPVLLVHGWGASVYTYRDLISGLADVGRRHYAVDLRGHGLSDKPVGKGQYATSALLADLRAIVDALALERVDLVGHSLGGSLALRFTLAEPERVGRLVLAAPVGLTRIRFRRFASFITPRITELGARFLVPRSVVSFLVHGAYGDPRRVAEEVVDQYWAPTRFPEYYRAVRSLLHEFDLAPLSPALLGQVKAPTLVILGGADRLIHGAEAAAAALARATVRTIAGAGHLVLEDGAPQVTQDIMHFLGCDIRVAPSTAIS